MSTAALNGETVAEFVPCNRQPFFGDTAPVAVTLTATVELSTEDLVAALFRWDTATPDEVDDDETARLYIAEAALNGGLYDLHATRAELAQLAPGDVRYPWAEYCRQRVSELYGGGTGISRSEWARGARLELVTA